MMDYLKNESCKKQSVQLKCFLDLAPNINFEENENKQIFPENMSNKINSRVTVTLLHLNHSYNNIDMLYKCLQGTSSFSFVSPFSNETSLH